MKLQCGVNRHAEEINQQRDRSRSRNEGIAPQIESQQRRRADSALIANQPAKHSRQSAGEPCRSLAETHAGRQAGDPHESREYQKDSQDVTKDRAAHPDMKECAHQATYGAGGAEGQQDAPVHVFANHDEAQRGSNEMRYRDHGHGEFCADPRGQQRSKNAADPKAGDGGDGSSQDASAT